ncbi:MAG: hypothetical protein ACRBCK_11905 [Alphaproteobacteria bacterium]
MSKFFLILPVFALIVSVTVCVSHAHASVETSSEIAANIDATSHADHVSDVDGCDMSCGGCCFHHAMDISYGVKDLISFAAHKVLLSDAILFVPDFVYGLKRPPKS